MPLLRRRIGVVFQDFRLLTNLSALDNVALPLRIAGVRESQVRQHVTELLHWVGLADHVSALPATLSGGQQQRVAIARAVIARPSLLLADEPTGNVDDSIGVRLMYLFEELNKMGTTVVIATHNERLVEQVRAPPAARRVRHGAAGRAARGGLNGAAAQRPAARRRRLRPLPAVDHGLHGLSGGAGAGRHHGRRPPRRPLAQRSLRHLLDPDPAERREHSGRARPSCSRDIVDAVGKMPEVASVSSRSTMPRSRSCWSPGWGADGLPEDLRLPDLVVVQLRSDAPAGFEAVKTRLAALAPESTIEDHARWQGDMLAFTHSIELLASIIIGLVAAAAVTTVIFVTKTGLSIHRRVIEIVHLVGARDSYIARQFLLHAMRLGLIGGIGGPPSPA